MKKKLCRFAIVIFLPATIPHVWGLQAGTPEEALEEMATAETVETVIKHLPVKVEEYMEKLPAPQRAAAAEKLLLKQNLERGGGTLTRSADGRSWELVEKQGGAKLTVTWKKTFVSGTDALVQFEVKEPTHTALIQVGMRYEANDWRLAEVGEWRGTEVESELLPKAGATEVHGSSAASTLRTLNTAIITYATTYPDVGYPNSLPALSGQANQEPASDHAMLLDPAFSQELVIRNGYQFRYTRTGQEHYQITATPVQYNDGLESFFTDETAVIRTTKETRPATASDPPLE
jgi:type IV pilus assembly protein PilA